MKISFLFTCYNRKEKTLKCIETILEAVQFCREKGLEIDDKWYITDAGSTDGTPEGIRNILASGEKDSSCTPDCSAKLHLHISDHNTFYSSGMRMCINDYLSGKPKDDEFVFLINDDVLFGKNFLFDMLGLEEKNMGRVLVGATEFAGIQTYGGVRYCKEVKGRSLFPRSIKYKMVGVDEENRLCNTFNANCVMIPSRVMLSCGSMDKEYIHSLGDFDYGLSIFEKGFDIISTDFYVGKCENNSKEGSWMDVSLKRAERVKKLNEVKGAPTKYWFYYLNKHFGFMTALTHVLNPYIKIMLKM